MSNVENDMGDDADTPGSYRRLGVLDIGSNSVRFVIYELFGAAFTPIYNEKVLAGLGRDLRKHGTLSASGKAEALAAIQRFKLIAKAQNLDRMLIGATAAMRMASDAPEFIKNVKTVTDLDISPISGKEEARLTALGLIAAEPRAKGIAADLGGASLELIEVANRKVGRRVSLPIGPFQIIGNDLSNPEAFDVERIRLKITQHLEASDVNLASGQVLYLIGGAWRNLAGIHQGRHLYPMRTLQAYALMPGAARDLAKWAYGEGLQDALNWPGIAKRRAETLPYSGLLLDILMERFAPSQVIISTNGLRAGLIYDALPEPLKLRDALLDGCRDLARGNLQGMHFAKPLYDFLAPLGSALPDAFEPENEERLRRAACHLVGIGKGLHPDYRADLVFDDVLYAPLAGLTHKERAYLALILFHSFTSAQDTPNSDAINLLLSLNERKTARIYGTAIRLGVVSSGRSSELLQQFHLNFCNNVLGLSVNSPYEALLTERVSHRLHKLGAVMQVDVEIQKNIIDKQ